MLISQSIRAFWALRECRSRWRVAQCSADSTPPKPPLPESVTPPNPPASKTRRARKTQRVHASQAPRNTAIPLIRANVYSHKGCMSLRRTRHRRFHKKRKCPPRRARSDSDRPHLKTSSTTTTKENVVVESENTQNCLQCHRSGGVRQSSANSPKVPSDTILGACASTPEILRASMLAPIGPGSS